jgi:hypothetical protein
MNATSNQVPILDANEVFHTIRKLANDGAKSDNKAVRFLQPWPIVCNIGLTCRPALGDRSWPSSAVLGKSRDERKSEAIPLQDSHNPWLDRGTGSGLCDGRDRDQTGATSGVLALAIPTLRRAFDARSEVHGLPRAGPDDRHGDSHPESNNRTRGFDESA